MLSAVITVRFTFAQSYVTRAHFRAVPGFPDRGYFGKNSGRTQTPLRAVAFTTLVSILPGLLDLASPIAANAIFSLTAMALDLSYVIPIFLRRVFEHHPDVMFKPGPFYMGTGFVGKAANWICIVWTVFICVIFSFPTIKPITPDNMNYASVSNNGPQGASPLIVFSFQGHNRRGHGFRIVSLSIAFSSTLISYFLSKHSAWYMISGHRHYTGPRSNLDQLQGGRQDLDIKRSKHDSKGDEEFA